MKTSLDVKAMALQRSLQILNSLGARYKVITDDGAEYGDLKVNYSTRKPSRYPLGSIRNYYGPIIKDMQVGDVKEVGVAQFDLDTLQSGIGSFAGRLWGNGSIVTQRDFEKKCIQVFRIA
jgi:hypothetical protein